MSAKCQQRTSSPLAVLKKYPATARGWLGGLKGCAQSGAYKINRLSDVSKKSGQNRPLLKISRPPSRTPQRASGVGAMSTSPWFKAPWPCPLCKVAMQAVEADNGITFQCVPCGTNNSRRQAAWHWWNATFAVEAICSAAQLLWSSHIAYSGRSSPSP